MVFISQVFQGFKRKSVCWSSEVVLDVFFVRTRSVQNLGYSLTGTERKLTLTKWGPVREITVADAT